jgi:hypothetical protein
MKKKSFFTDIPVEHIKNKFVDIRNKSLLTKEDIVLLALLDLRCINSTQVKELFDYASIRSAQRLLDKLDKKGYLFSKMLSKLKGAGKTYFLTNLGIEKTLSLKNLPLYVIDEQGETKKMYYSQYENSISTAAIPHLISTNDFYISIMKSKYNFTFEWFDERQSQIIIDKNDLGTELDEDVEAIINTDDKMKSKGVIALRPDASFIMNDKEFLIEQDLGTEGKKRLAQKFANYTNVFEKIEDKAKPLPKLLFSIYLKRNIDGEFMKVVKRKLHSLEEEKKALKKQIDMFKDVSNISKDISINSIEKDRKFIQLMLQLDTLTNQQKKELKEQLKRIEILENVKESVQYLESLKKQYKDFQNKIDEERNNLIESMLSNQYSIRMENIKHIMYGSNDVIGLRSLIEKGMDVYVNRADVLRNYIIEYVALSKTGMDKVTQYLNLTINAYKEEGFNVSWEKIDKYEFLYNHTSYIADRYYQIEFEHDSVTYFEPYYIFDLTFNNVGSEYRLYSLLDNLDISFKEINKPDKTSTQFIGGIYCIVDNVEQAKVIEKKYRDEFLSDLIHFVNVEPFEEDDAGVYKIKNEIIVKISEE